jgi:hypothetical protein
MVTVACLAVPRSRLKIGLLLTRLDGAQPESIVEIARDVPGAWGPHGPRVLAVTADQVWGTGWILSEFANTY